MAQTLYWNPNTLVLPQGNGVVRLFQVSQRRNVLATTQIVDLIDSAVGGCPTGHIRELHERLGATLRLADATTFSLWGNAYSNSDYLDREVKAEQLEPMSFDGLVELLTESGMLSDVWPPVHDTRKRSFGDRFRGTLHEQLATEALYNRTTPAAWWTAQKFTDDCSRTRPTPYRYIEEQFLEDYFRAHLPGLNVLEIGCGTGYFTAKIANHARTAIGMDFNEDYLSVARRNWAQDSHPNLEFRAGDIIDLSKGGWSSLEGNFDRVVLIDTFLFLFDASYQHALFQQRDTILQNMKRLIAPGGQMLIMDPHPFWLTAWLGLERQPFGIVTEYRHRAYKVSPSLEEVSGFLYKNDLRVRRILEPAVGEEYRDVNPQGHAFMTQFPQWWFWEVEAAGDR